MGREAITDRDVSEAAGSSLSRYDMVIKRVSLATGKHVAEALIEAKEREAEFDLTALVRGGGDLSAVDSIEAAEAALTLDKPFVTALGHAVDAPLLEAVADKAFTTPTALGRYLSEVAALAESRLSSGEVALENRVKRVEEALKEAQALNDALTRRLREVEKEKNDVMLERDVLAKHLRELEADVAKLEEQNNKLVGMLDDFAAENQKLTEEIERLRGGVRRYALLAGLFAAGFAAGVAACILFLH